VIIFKFKVYIKTNSAGQEVFMPFTGSDLQGISKIIKNLVNILKIPRIQIQNGSKQ